MRWPQESKVEKSYPTIGSEGKRKGPSRREQSGRRKRPRSCLIITAKKQNFPVICNPKNALSDLLGLTRLFSEVRQASFFPLGLSMLYIISTGKHGIQRRQVTSDQQLRVSSSPPSSATYDAGALFVLIHLPICPAEWGKVTFLVEMFREKESRMTGYWMAKQVWQNSTALKSCF